MKILKHGRVFTFRCESCGCEFVTSAASTQDLGFYRRAICPDCGAEARQMKDYDNYEEEPDERPE